MHGTPSKAFSDYVNVVSVALSPGGASSAEHTPRFLISKSEDVHPILSTSDRKKVKALIRSQNWPVNHDVRHTLWAEIGQLVFQDVRHEYSETGGQIYGEDVGEEIAPAHFVDPAHRHNYHLTTSGVHTVLRLLGVVADLHPHITYCPLLYPIASLMLHYMKPEDCYNCISGLLQRNYVTQTKQAHATSTLVLRDLAKKFAKSCYTYLVRHSKHVEHVFENWQRWIFKDLPLPYLVKVIDCFLLEGPKILYRVALAILIVFNKHSVKVDSSANIPDAIIHLCQNMPISEDRLMKVAFGIRGLQRNDIHRFRVKGEMELASQDRLPHMNNSASHDDLALRVSNSFCGSPANAAVHPCKSDIISHKECLHKVTRWRSLGVIPLAEVDSSILILADVIWSWLPRRMTVYQPTLLFTTEEHGISILSLFSRTQGHGATFLVIKTMDDEVFGAFCSSDWGERHQHGNFLAYFGTGETFLFSIYPHRRKYEWIGIKDPDSVTLTGHMFMAGDNTMLTVGGGNGEGLQVDSDLNNGRTEHCDTFNNEPLCAQVNFRCKIVEVFGFE